MVERSRTTAAWPPARIADGSQLPVLARLRVDEPVEDAQLGRDIVVDRSRRPAGSGPVARARSHTCPEAPATPGVIRLTPGAGPPQVVRHPLVRRPRHRCFASSDLSRDHVRPTSGASRSKTQPWPSSVRRVVRSGCLASDLGPLGLLCDLYGARDRWHCNRLTSSRHHGPDDVVATARPPSSRCAQVDHQGTATSSVQ